MTAIRFIFAFYVAASVSPLAIAEEIEIKVERTNTFWMSGPTYRIYVNDRVVGDVKNGQTKVFSFPHANFGKNEVRAEKISWVDTVDYYENAKKIIPAKKYFLVRETGQKVVLKLGPSDKTEESHLYKFEISDEVDKSWTPPTIVRVSFDPNLDEEVIKKGAKIDVKANIGKVVKDTLLIRRITTISESWEASESERRSITSKWFAVQGEIGQRLLRETQQSTEVEKSTERSVTVTERKSKWIRVVWKNLYRKGTALLKDGEKEIEVPFRFLEDFDLVIENVDD